MNPAELQDKLLYTLNSFSYSKISAFFDCSAYWAMYYLHDMKPEGESPALAKGTKLHEYYHVLCDPQAKEKDKKLVLEQFPRTYPLEWLKYVNRWKRHEDSLPKGVNMFFEKELSMRVPANVQSALDAAGIVPTKRKDLASVYFKGYVDYVNNNVPDLAIVIDFKSGKASTDPKYSDQLAIYALLVFSNFPQVRRVKAYTYDISGNMDNETTEANSLEFDRANDLEQLTSTLTKIVENVIDAALVKKRFVPTPCIRCNYCPDYACRFNRVRNRARPVNLPRVQPATEPPKELDTYSAPVLQEQPVSRDNPDIPDTNRPLGVISPSPEPSSAPPPNVAKPLVMDGKKLPIAQKRTTGKKRR